MCKFDNLLWSLTVCLRYLEEALEERKKISFYANDLPICNKLLNKEILKVSEMIPNQEFNYLIPDVAAINLGRWDGNYGPSPHQHKTTLQGRAIGHGNAAPTSRSSVLAKKILRLDVPVDRYPDFNFVGRLLGPRGNSLKRIEALTGCRIFIRGRGSMKDPLKESFRRRSGHKHLHEPLHIIIEANAPTNVVDVTLRQAKEIIEELLIPVNYSGDEYKKQQLRELAMLNSLYGDDTYQASTSSGTMKWATAARKGTL